MLTRIASRRTPCRVYRALPQWGRWGAGFLPISLAGNQEFPPSPPPHLLPLPPPAPPPPPPSFPNGSYQTHQDICDRTISNHEKTATNIPRGGRLWVQMLCICAFFFFFFLSVHASVRFLPKLTEWEAVSCPCEVEDSFKVQECFCPACRGKLKAHSYCSYFLSPLTFSLINYCSDPEGRWFKCGHRQVNLL